MDGTSSLGTNKLATGVNVAVEFRRTFPATAWICRQVSSCRALRLYAWVLGTVALFSIVARIPTLIFERRVALDPIRYVNFANRRHL